MSLRTQYEFLFVGRDEGSFVENYAYDLGEGGENSGKIFINLEIQNNPADAETIGEVIFDTVRKVFYSDPEKDPYVRFEDSIKAVNKALAQMKEEKSSKYLGNMNVLIAAIADNNLYITQTGDAEAYLMRKRLCSTISEGLDEEGSADVFCNIASGTLEPNDFILLNSTRLLRYVSKTDLAKICSGRSLVSSLTELKDFLSTEVLAKIGLIGIFAGEKTAAFTSEEKGQIVAHLEKEEFVASKSESAGANSMKALKGAVSKLTSAVDDLRKRVSSPGRVVQSAARRGSERVEKATAGWGRDKIIITAIVAILLLTGGFWWLKSRAAEQATIDNYAKTLTTVRETIASAETTGQYNKDQAGQMLTQAEKDALVVLNSGYHRSKANELLQSIQDSRDKLDGVMRPAVTVLADLSQKRQNVSALGMLAMNGNLYAYEYNALYPVVLDKVQDPLSIDENETVVAATTYEDTNSLMFYTKSGKIIEYVDGRMSFVDTADGNFKKAVALQGYSNKLYLLDPEDNQIWRYTRRRDKFDAGEAWNVNADLKNGISLAIDGNIYVLNKDGFITKLFSGNKEDFPIKKLPVKPLTNPTRIYTELDMSQIYVLEPSEKRVLVYYKDDKTGGATYDKQFVFDDLTDLRDLYVDKDTGKMYLMDGSKIYTVAL
jgi:hypothetical protein